MPKIRSSTGGAYTVRGAFYMRATVAPQKRHAELLPWCTSMPDALARANLVQGWVNRLRAADRSDYIQKVVELGAAAATARALAYVADDVDHLCTGNFEPIDLPKQVGGPVTFRTFAERWTSGELHRLYPDHVGAKDSSDDEYRLAVVNEVIGDVPLASFTIDDADRAMSSIEATRRKQALAAGRKEPKLLEPAARRQYAQFIHRVLKLAAYPARILKASPLPPGWLPRTASNKAKGLLYPEEEAATLGCTKYELHWRIFFGFLARSGFRVDEAAGLTMSDVDLDHGVITLDVNKTDDPRAPTYGPELTTALKMWRDKYRADAKPDDLFFTRPDGSRIPVDRLADFYREHFVRDAGVTRPELFVRSKNRIPLRVHDLRGFFVTYALAGGATETWVMDRTGHKSSTMVNRYRRVARTVAEAGLGSPTPLHLAIPELAAAFTAANAAAERKKAGPKKHVSDRNQKIIGPIAQSVELRTFNP
jgi:integrase